MFGLFREAFSAIRYYCPNENVSLLEDMGKAIDDYRKKEKKPNYKYDSFEEWLDSLSPNFNSEREFLEAIKEMFEAARETREVKE